ELVAAGHTILLASHDPEVVASSCRRALLLEGGRITRDDLPGPVGQAYLDLLHARPGDAGSPMLALGSPSPEPPSRPKVSVIIPCYNLGQYVDEAVQSVLDQTFQDFEILIVNDGSTDPETNRLLTGYDRPKTRVMATENRGLPSARNLAIEHATGE